MKRTGRWRLVFAVAVVLAAAVYLHDPPWVGTITSGMRPWEEDRQGTRFRWTAGRASFFVPSDAASMTLPMRAIFPGVDGRPTTVSVSVDGRWLTNVELADPDRWVQTVLPLPRRGSRRYRRVDLHVSRVVGWRLFGVQIGVVDAPAH